MIRGTIAGGLTGLVALASVLAVAVRCLPYRIALPPHPWPWYCADPAYRVIGSLAFPVNLLTNDLSRAVLLGPLALASYALLGALIGGALVAKRRSWR
jgi:hypothetical protein